MLAFKSYWYTFSLDMFKLVGKKCSGFSHASTLVTSWMLCSLYSVMLWASLAKEGSIPPYGTFYTLVQMAGHLEQGQVSKISCCFPELRVFFGPGWYMNMLETDSVAVLERGCSGDWVAETRAVWSWVLEQSSVLISVLKPKWNGVEVKLLSCTTDIHGKIMQHTQIPSVLESTSHHEQALKQVNVSTSVSQPYYRKLNFFEYFKLHPF